MNRGRTKYEQWGSILLLFLPFLLVVLIMLPRLLSPQFGFEDDGMSLAMARKALAGMRIDSDDNLGFFRPFYWLGLVLEYWLGGTNPFWFYFVNLLVLIIIVVEIMVLIRLKGGNVIQSSLSAIVFVLSSPMVESFYTNSKPEAQQLMWLTSSLLSGHYLVHTKGNKRFAAIVVTTLFILFASLNKSTFIVLIPVSFAWLVLCWLFLRQDREEIKRATYYFASTLLATALFFILRQLTLSTSILQGTYANNYMLNVNFMVFMMNHWIVWLTRGYLGLFVCLVLLLVFWTKLDVASRKLALASLVWVFGWFVIYLPWDRALDYYLLPFALGYSVFCGVVIGALPPLWQGLRKSFKIISASLVSLFALLVFMSTATDISNAKIQLMMDRQDMQLLNYLARNSVPGANIGVNFDGNATFFTHVPLLMSILGNRGDITFIPFQFQNNLSENKKPYLLIMPVVKNQPLVKVRGYGEEQTPANKSLDAFIKNIKPAFETSEKIRLLTFNPIILLCPFTRQLPFYSIHCNKPASLPVDSRDYSFGWQVYEINTSMRHMAAPAVYTLEGELKIYDQEGPSSQYSFSPSNHPMSVDWNADGLTDIVLFNSKDLAWQVFLFPFGQRPLTFAVPGMTAKDVPLTGDWNCDGKASPGYYRPTDSSWHLWGDLDGGEVVTALTRTRPNDIPIVGDWDGDGCDTVGVYRPDKGEVNLENNLTADLGGIDFNAPMGVVPVPSDWGGLGVDTLGFYKDGLWQISYANCECLPANGFRQFEFGKPDDIPLAGKWK
jgi:hypothetical protein